MFLRWKLATLCVFTSVLIAGLAVGAGIGITLSPWLGNPDRNLLDNVVAGATLGLFAGPVCLFYIWSRTSPERLAWLTSHVAAARGIPVPADLTAGAGKISPATLVLLLGSGWIAFCLSLTISYGPGSEGLTVTESGLLSFAIILFGAMIGLVCGAIVDVFGKTWNDRPGAVCAIFGLCLATNVLSYAGVQQARAAQISALMAKLDDSEPAVRREAARALGKLSPAPVSALPALLAKRPDSESNAQASEALYQIGLRLHRYGNDEQAARALVGALFPADGFGFRGDAVATLKQLGPSAALELAALLKSRDPAERETAASTLKELGTGGIPAVPALREALSDPVRSVRDAAACALAECAPETREIVPVLKEMTTGTDLEKQLASEALGRLKTQADAASALLEPLLASGNSLDVRLAAACSLVRLGRAKPGEVVPCLVDVLESRPRFRSVIEACDALAALGPTAREAIGPLEQLASITTWPSPFSQDNREYQASEIRRHAAAALGRVKGSPESTNGPPPP